MLMADTMAIFFVILGLMLAFPGLWLLCRGLWPEMTSGAAERCRKGLVKPFLVGLPITAGIIFAGTLLSRRFGAAGQIGTAGLICVYMVYAHTGVSGLATFIGQRLPSSADAARPWNATLRGGIVLELSYLLPILGWFVILPSSIIIGCGSSTLSLFKHRQVPSAMAAPTPSGPTIRINGDAADVRAEGPVGASR